MLDQTATCNNDLQTNGEFFALRHLQLGKKCQNWPVAVISLPYHPFLVILQAAKTGMEAQMMKIAASPAALPKIDFDTYKRMLPGVAMVDDFQVHIFLPKT